MKNLFSLTFLFLFSTFINNAIAVEDNGVHYYDDTKLESASSTLNRVIKQFAVNDSCNRRCKQTFRRFVISLEDLRSDILATVEREEMTSALLSMVIMRTHEINQQDTDEKIRNFLEEENIHLEDFYDDLSSAVRKRRNWRRFRYYVGGFVSLVGVSLVGPMASISSGAVISVYGHGGAAILTGLTYGPIYFIAKSVRSQRLNNDLLEVLQSEEMHSIIE